MAAIRRNAPTGPRRQKGSVHYPARNGAACGIHPAPTDARDYSLTDPTCEWCAWYLRSVNATADAPDGDTGDDAGELGDPDAGEPSAIGDAIQRAGRSGGGRRR
jgi:hypothetical protein